MLINYYQFVLFQVIPWIGHTMTFTIFSVKKMQPIWTLIVLYFKRFQAFKNMQIRQVMTSLNYYYYNHLCCMFQCGMVFCIGKVNKEAMKVIQKALTTKNTKEKVDVLNFCFVSTASIHWNIIFQNQTAWSCEGKMWTKNLFFYYYYILQKFFFNKAAHI